MAITPETADDLISEILAWGQAMEAWGTSRALSGAEVADAAGTPVYDIEDLRATDWGARLVATMDDIPDDQRWPDWVDGAEMLQRVHLWGHMMHWLAQTSFESRLLPGESGYGQRVIDLESAEHVTRWQWVLRLEMHKPGVTAAQAAGWHDQLTVTAPAPPEVGTLP